MIESVLKETLAISLESDLWVLFYVQDGVYGHEPDSFLFHLFHVIAMLVEDGQDSTEESIKEVAFLDLKGCNGIIS